MAFLYNLEFVLRVRECVMFIVFTQCAMYTLYPEYGIITESTRYNYNLIFVHIRTCPPEDERRRDVLRRDADVHRSTGPSPASSSALPYSLYIPVEIRPKLDPAVLRESRPTTKAYEETRARNETGKLCTECRLERI